MPYQPKQPNHTTEVARVYAPKIINEWWTQLTSDERGEALKTLIELKPELLNTITWKRTD
jgi:hypothetical protein